MGSIVDNQRWPRPVVACGFCGRDIPTREGVFYDHLIELLPKFGGPMPDTCEGSGTLVDDPTRRARQLPPTTNGDCLGVVLRDRTGLSKFGGWSADNAYDDPMRWTSSSYHKVRLPMRDHPQMWPEFVAQELRNSGYDTATAELVADVLYAARRSVQNRISVDGIDD